MTDRSLRALKVCLIAAVLTGLAALYLSLTRAGVNILCPFFALTGLYCPGCGTTRALFSLFDGKFLTAFRYNAFAPVLLPLIPVYAVWRSICYIKDGGAGPKINEKLLFALHIALFLYGALRNLPCYPFTLLAPLT